MQPRHLATAAAAAVLLLPLAACGGGDTDNSSKPGKKQPAASESVDCLSQAIGQEKWMEHCADKADAAEEEAEEKADLKFGQTYTWDDGVKVTVTQAEKVTKFGEFDIGPNKGETGFRVHVTFDNSSKKPLDLDEMSILVEGATNGGQAESTTFEAGAAEITGRVALGVKTTKNSDWVLADEYGKQVLVTVQRVSEDTDLFAQDPHWTGPIR